MYLQPKRRYYQITNIGIFTAMRTSDLNIYGVYICTELLIVFLFVIVICLSTVKSFDVLDYASPTKYLGEGVT